MWVDYFHDSDVVGVVFDHEKALLQMKVQCSLDMDKAWESLNEGTEDYEQYIASHMDEFTYVLTFNQTVYFNMERELGIGDYLCGRFRKTARLERYQAQSDQELYQFRIQFADGYCDIIFSEFSVCKIAGQIDVTPMDVLDPTPKGILSVSEENLLAQVRHGDDENCFAALRTLYETKYEGLLALLRSQLRLLRETEVSCLYACFLLGKYGELEDVAALMSVYGAAEQFYSWPQSQYLVKREILDAVESIQLRCLT